MTERTRYPGAQPFSDDELSRKTFFGREREAGELANIIIASRLTVVYAKSGVGKSSLLNAGVAQRLRDQNFLPLSVRVNDPQNGPLRAVLDGIRAAVDRSGVEYHPGDETSLWHFFKTVEFWKGDLLLTPVLIIDQFEEIFTLQGAGARAAFLLDLGYLVRGVAPVESEAQDGLTEKPPVLQIVLSLREDYLGFLEEASDRIPQILDNRFRLSPLSLERAAEAMTGPAAITDEALRTRPFGYHPDTIEAIIEHLSRRSTRTSSQAMRYVEPFQLQLVCRRVEQIVAARQQTGEPVTVTLAMIGGEAALTDTLQDFYTEQVKSIGDWRTRRAIRRLCQEYLISPEGRRLSIEQDEIRREVDVTPDVLAQLVDRRLLRSDQRADSTYYELSHDTLVEPILATRRVSGRLIGTVLAAAGGLVVFIMAAIFIVILVEVGFDLAGLSAFMLAATLLLFPLMFVGYLMFRRGVRTVRRYRSRT
jgi:hypothetical protein